MKTVFEHLRKHLCSWEEDTTNRLPPLDKLTATQWSAEFETYMRNRLIMGAFRYGMFGAEGKPHYDHMKAIRKKTELFEQTGNLELLVDIANYAMCEYREGIHPLRHWGPTDDTDHAEVKK